MAVVELERGEVGLHRFDAIVEAAVHQGGHAARLLKRQVNPTGDTRPQESNTPPLHPAILTPAEDQVAEDVGADFPAFASILGWEFPIAE